MKRDFITSILIGGGLFGIFSGFGVADVAPSDGGSDQVFPLISANAPADASTNISTNVSTDDPINASTLVSTNASMDESMNESTNESQRIDFYRENEAAYRFAFKWFGEVSQENATKNSVVSPLGCEILLASLYLGGDGTTKRQLGEALGISDDATAGFDRWAKKLDFLNAAPETTLANGIWIQNDYSLKTDYLERLRRFFSLEVRSVDFKTPDATKEINRWVETKTDGKINKLFDSLSDDAKFVLNNVVLFKGEWKNEFDPAATRNADFVNWDGTKTRTPTMRQTNKFRYYESDEYQQIEIPYRDDRFSAILVLPKENVSFDALEKRWNATFLEIGDRDAQETEVELILPKFAFSFDLDAIPSLKALGIDEMFSAEANFQSATEADDLMISQFKQRLRLEFDEQGTQAIAATGAEGSLKSIRRSIVFSADRPFLFLVRENQTGAILFVGRVVRMN